MYEIFMITKNDVKKLTREIAEADLADYMLKLPNFPGVVWEARKSDKTNNR